MPPSYILIIRLNHLSTRFIIVPASLFSVPCLILTLSYLILSYIFTPRSTSMYSNPPAVFACPLSLSLCYCRPMAYYQTSRLSEPYLQKNSSKLANIHIYLLANIHIYLTWLFSGYQQTACLCSTSQMYRQPFLDLHNGHSPYAEQIYLPSNDPTRSIILNSSP